MIKGSELTNEEKAAIGEFIFSAQIGTLIKSEAEKAISVLNSKGINDIELDEDSIVSAIENNIEHDSILEIIDQYLAGKL